MIERMFLYWEHASLWIFAALGCLIALIASFPQVNLAPPSRSGVAFSRAAHLPGHIVFSIDNDENESLEDDLEPCWLPVVRLDSPLPLSRLQISQESLSLSLLNSAPPPLRC